MIHTIDSPPCNDPRPCFAKMEYRGQQRCRILVETYHPGKRCPFCKTKNTDVVKKGEEK